VSLLGLELAQRIRRDRGLVQSCVCCCLLLFPTAQTLTSELAEAEQKVTVKRAELWAMQDRIEQHPEDVDALKVPHPVSTVGTRGGEEVC
jgi:hypothetical protein